MLRTKKSHDTCSASWESSRRRREVNVRNRKEPANDKTSVLLLLRNPVQTKQIIMTYPAVESSLWRIRFTQGSCCWSENTFDQNPTGEVSILHRPLRVKKALAFLHSVFSNYFSGPAF